MDNISYWIDNTKLKNFEELKDDLECDVCIIGGRYYWYFYCI